MYACDKHFNKCLNLFWCRLDSFRATKSCCPNVPAVRFYLVGTVGHILFVNLQLNLWDFSLNTFKVTKYNVR